LPAVSLQPSRTVEELNELRELTGDEEGAQRVAWTDTWVRAREWLSGKLDPLGVTEETDEAGNQWFTLAGASEKALLIGGHIDSVPNGGWLDGALNVVAGIEVLRRIAEEGRPPVTVRLVNWADEEGARFGRSLFGGDGLALHDVAIPMPLGAAVAMTAPAASRPTLRFGVGIALVAFFLGDQRLPVSDRDLVIVRVDFREREEAVAVAAIVHKRRL